jgi:hypothetical protein
MNRVLLKLVSVVTIFMFSATTLFADPSTAMLYPVGAVLLNGSSVPGATAIFNGDLVKTMGGSIANFSTKNSHISITADTSVKIEGSGVNLMSGVVTVDTHGGCSTHAARYTVSPSGATAKYRVLRKDDAIVVASLGGPLVVTWGTNSKMLASGTSWASPVGEDADAPSSDVPKGHAPHVALSPRLSTGTLILIGGGMAGLAAGLAVAASQGHSVSPVRTSK